MSVSSMGGVSKITSVPSTAPALCQLKKCGVRADAWRKRKMRKMNGEIATSSSFERCQEGSRSLHVHRQRPLDKLLLNMEGGREGREFQIFSSSSCIRLFLFGCRCLSPLSPLPISADRQRKKKKMLLQKSPLQSGDIS